MWKRREGSVGRQPPLPEIFSIGGKGPCDKSAEQEPHGNDSLSGVTYPPSPSIPMQEPPCGGQTWDAGWAHVSRLTTFDRSSWSHGTSLCRHRMLWGKVRCVLSLSVNIYFLSGRWRWRCAVNVTDSQ